MITNVLHFDRLKGGLVIHLSLIRVSLKNKKRTFYVCLIIVAEWLGHSKMDTTRQYYANADTTMKQEAIEKATSKLNPIISGEIAIDWEDDEVLLKKLYGLK